MHSYLQAQGYTNFVTNDEGKLSPRLPEYLQSDYENYIGENSVLFNWII